MTNQEEILSELAAGNITSKQAADLLAELNVVTFVKPGTVSFRVSQKKGISVYGLGRWPTTLYIGQWERLIDAIPQLIEFAKEHANELERKVG